MTIKIASGSPSLTFTSVDSGVRFVVHAFLTSSDFVFWWYVSSGQLANNYFYGKDFVDALTAIRNGADSAVVPIIVPQTNPADDYPRGDSVTIYGRRLSTFYGKNQVVNLSQNGDDVTMTTPVTATASFELNIQNANVIDCLQDAARGENNALCRFNSNVYSVGTFFKE